MLGYTKITDKGLVLLAKAVKKQELKELGLILSIFNYILFNIYLEECNISKKGLKFWAEAVKEQHNLEKLNLDLCNFEIFDYSLLGNI